MLKNYFRTAFRSFMRQRTYSFINLSGLCIGLTCSIFIGLWVMDELSYDKFHADSDRIFQVMENQTYSGGVIYTFNATPGLLAEALRQEFPEVEASCRTDWERRLLFQHSDKSIYEEGLYADPSLFQVFTFPILDGDAKNPLPDNNSIAISQRMAAKFFGAESAIGKTFKVNAEWDAKVTAVFKDVPENSSLKFEWLIAFDRTFRAPGNSWMGRWGANGLQTFLKLNKDGAEAAVNNKIKEFIKKRNEGSVVDLFAFPLKDWRLRNNFENGKQTGGRIGYVWAFELVAVFILLIACINFMNLATARAVKRSKEVGVRKVVGAERWSIILQFMAESIGMVFVALGIALLLVYLLTPYFNDLTNKKIFLDYSQPQVIIGLLSVLLFAGVTSGSYPAFVLSSFRPATVLKGKLTGALGGGALRRVLVVFQFSLSVALIVCALVVYQQMNYIHTKNLGYDRENTLYFTKRDGVSKSFENFRAEAIQNPLIENVALSSTLPMSVGQSDGADWDGKSKDENVLFPLIQCDHEYLKLANFVFTDGRNFSRDVASDSMNYVITEEAAKRMHMEHPIGQRLKVWDREGQIIGVVKDFHSSSLYNGIEPVIFMYLPKETWAVFVRYQPGEAENAAKLLGVLHKKFEPNFPFEPEFLDDAFNRQYRSESMIGKLSTVFTVMAIFISCLGLFGLASYTTEQRTKEIGIRKVMGASVSRLAMMLCRDFVLLVLISLVAGLPFAYYVMQKFLSQYKFHTEMGGWMCVLTAVSILLIAIGTVAYQSLTASMRNPVTSLRIE
jgi:ABC-type antimicrobial peptide transport system permease subunit